MKLTQAQRRIMKYQKMREKLDEWTRDVYMGGYASDVHYLYTNGLLERREWQVPNVPGMTFGYEYRIRKQS